MFVVAFQVIELLIVTCWISEQGHKSVMDALKSARFSKRFQVVVDLLGWGENVNVKVFFDQFNTSSTSLVCSSRP